MVKVLDDGKDESPMEAPVQPRAEDQAVVHRFMASGELLASQLPSPSLWSAELKLAGAVLASALIEVRDRHTDLKFRRSIKEDLEWIFSNEGTWPFSFVRLCSLFHLEPEYVRRVVSGWLDAEPAPKQRQCSPRRHAA